MIYDFDKFSSGDFIIFPNNDLWPRRAVRAEHRIKKYENHSCKWHKCLGTIGRDICRLKVYFQFADNRMQFDSKYCKTITMDECGNIYG